MAYTEKVSISGTALSFLFYECSNSVDSQEGFLIGDVTSEITNHISDSQSDNARLDTQVVIRTVLPLPAVSVFYLPTGRIKEELLSQLLLDSAHEVVGWYKFRKNSSIKPTFRDKLLSKGLQKYFEKNHGRKTFVTCNVSNKTSPAGSTHTFMYRFGKINCLDMYEYIEDVTANLGEKVMGYKKVHRSSPSCIFNKIVKESNLGNNTSNDAILYIQEAVDTRLIKEARIVAKNECVIRELEAEIKHMNAILTEKLAVDLQSAYDKINEEKLRSREIEMAEAYVEALKTPPEIDILTTSNIQMNSNHLSDSDNSIQYMGSEVQDRSPSPIMPITNLKVKPKLNYAAALKNSSEIASTSKTNNFNEDLICFDVEDKQVKQKPTYNSDDLKCLDDSSPEY